MLLKIILLNNVKTRITEFKRMKEKKNQGLSNGNHVIDGSKGCLFPQTLKPLILPPSKMKKKYKYLNYKHTFC